MHNVMANPYAASMFEAFLKYSTIPIQPRNSNTFVAEINNCPLSSVGYWIFNFGHRFNRIASLINVKDPEINAWLAIIAAAVAMAIPKYRNQSGMSPKK